MSTYQEKMRGEIYRLMDSFLTESNDQNGNPRSLDRLNQDRHLFVENMESHIKELALSMVEEDIKAVEGMDICIPCDGQGWTAEHDTHPPSGECVNCPTQVQCSNCQATGHMGDYSAVLTHLKAKRDDILKA